MLVAAFVLSILVHTLIAFFVHPPRPTRTVAIESFRHTLVQTIRRVTPAPLRPTPHRASVSAPHVVAAHALREKSAPAPSQAPPAAARVASRTPPPAGSRCTQPNAPASVIAAASPPPIPAGVRAEHVAATAAIDVRLDATGAVQSASIAQSTTSPSFDALSIAMARETQYAPARRDCKAIASSYLFRVQWAPW